MMHRRSFLPGLLLAPLPLAWPARRDGARVEGLTAELMGHFDESMRKFLALAEAMPGERYGWSPGEGVMSVARVYAHVARYNYLYPATSLGSAAPEGRDAAAAEDLTEKAAVITRLRQSGDHVRQVVARLPEGLARETTLYGRRVPEWAVLLQLVAHMNEHLGQAIAYARMNGVVPPWSR